MKSASIFILILIAVFAVSGLSYGYEWERVVIAPEIGEIQDLVGTDEALFAITHEALYKSLDAGNTWENTTPSTYLEYKGRGKQGGFYSLDLDGKILYVGTKPGLMVSRDYVDFAWEFEWGWDPVCDVDVEQGYGYMAISRYGSSSGIFIKTPGSGWMYNKGSSATMVIADPLQPDKVAYAHMGDFKYYRTRDGGQQWTALTDLPATMVNVAVINNISCVVASDGYSFDSGDTWLNFPSLKGYNYGRYYWYGYVTACIGYKNGMLIASSDSKINKVWLGSPDKMIDTGLRHQDRLKTLAVSQDHLFSVSSGGNLFRWGIPDVIMGVEEEIEPAGFFLAQNYPNPFNPITTITYSLPVDQNVLLTIHSITGQEVATLANGYKTAGQYSVSWDGNGYSAGVYIAVIRTGDYYEAIKMILLK
ncbi:MAG: T9SS type A sorting domain-containing protein [Patescibacteria group bacterium]|nr:T9SS type A sorting domain-containing protein [Patescibacteria group bacterium]